MIFRIVGSVLILLIAGVAYMQLDESGNTGVQSSPVQQAPAVQPGNDAFQNLKM